MKKAKTLRSSKLKKLVLYIINDMSGGCKFTELLQRVLEELYNNGKKWACHHPEVTIFNTSFSSKLEKLVRKMPELKVVDYVWKNAYGKRLDRSKMFVCTP